jgi:hypothetical protein
MPGGMNVEEFGQFDTPTMRDLQMQASRLGSKLQENVIQSQHAHFKC